MGQRQFGISTGLYRRHRLSREHILEIASHGFDAVDLFAERSHFDFHNPSGVADLQQWLAEAGVSLHGIHAPVAAALASPDRDTRVQAVAEAERALHVARRIPATVLITHLGTPRGSSPPPASGTAGRAAAQRSIEELAASAAPLGVRVALEVIPNELSRAGSLVHFLEHELEELGTAVGVCLDFGHAHMAGDLLDTIETVSEHLLAVELHDNRGRADEHLAPFEGTIDWPAAVTAVQKIGYDGTFVFELAPHGTPSETLQRARAARERIERLLDWRLTTGDW